MALRAERDVAGSWTVEHLMKEIKVSCLVTDPLNSKRIYAGTQGDGTFVSKDAGATWERGGLKDVPIKSLEVSDDQPGVIYPGGKSVSLLSRRIWER